MTKVAIITDTHLGARNDNTDIMENQKRFFSEVFFPELERQKVTHVLHGGDLGDRRKFVNYKTAYELEQSFMKPCREGGYETHVIAGNHDTFYKNTNEINALDILYGHAVGDRLKLYTKGPETIRIDGHDFLLSPWICDENHDQSVQAIAASRAPVLLGHFEISGFEMLAGTLCTHGLDKSIFGNFDSVWSGHFHHPSEYANIKYLGAPYEMTWSDYQGKRGFHIYDTATRELRFYQNPLQMFHKIYYNDDTMTLDDVQALDVSMIAGKAIKLMVRRKNNPYVFDILMDKIAEAGALDVKIIDETARIIHDEAQVIDEAEDTPTIIKKYVETIEVKANKDRVNELLQTLYTESLQI